MQVAWRLGPVADDHIHLALGQTAVVIGIARQGVNFDATQGRVGFEVRHQMGQKEWIQVVTGRQQKGLAGSGWIEPACIGKHDFRRSQDVRSRLDHPQAGWRRHHTGARTHQQRVPRQFPQAPQGGTDRRLVHAQPDGSPGNVAFSQHGMENADQMKIYLVEKRLILHTPSRMKAIPWHICC